MRSLLTLILGGVWLRVWILQDAAPEALLRPYQRLDHALSGASRTLHRTLLSSVPDVVMLREQEGLWPEAELLTAASVPPFAPRFLPPSLRNYVWLGYDGGSWIDYVGQSPESEASPTSILRLIDLHAAYHPHPHPGVDYDPAVSVAAQVWFVPESGRPYPGERLPEAGWLWRLSPDDPVLQRQGGQEPKRLLAERAANDQ